MIQVIERSLQILEAVAEEPETPKGLGEIAAQVGLNAATCARILQTLVAAGYVEQMGRKKGYRLGPMVYALGARGPYRRDLVYAAEPLLRQLAEATRETVLLAVLRQGRRIVLSQVEGGQEVQVRGDLLQMYEPCRSATGMLLLAYLDEDGLRVSLKSDEPDGEKLLRELALARAEGRLIRRSRGQVVGIAYPVWEGERVAAALGLYLPDHRFSGEHQERVLEGMRRTASAIGERIADRSVRARQAAACTSGGGASGGERDLGSVPSDLSV